MGFNKSILLLGLSFAIVLLISSEVAARELAETSTTSSENTEGTNGVDDAKYGGGGYPGGGNGGYPGGGYGGNRGGGNGGYGGNRGGGGGGYCRYGCCGRGFNGRGCSCCSYAGEAMEVETQAKPHN